MAGKSWVVRQAGSWSPEHVGGIESCTQLLTQLHPFVYVTLNGEFPDLYKAPFTEMESFQLEVNATPSQMGRLAHFSQVRAIEFKCSGVNCSGDEASWRVRMFVEGGALKEWEEKVKACLQVGKFDISCHQRANTHVATPSQVEQLTSHAKLGRPVEARQILEEIIAAGGRPDRYAWSALVSAYAKLGQIHQMEMVIQEMGTHGFAPNDHAYNMMVAAYSRHGCPRQIREVFGQMEAKGIQKNKFLYTSLLAAYAKCGRAKEAVRVMDEMTADGVEPTVVTYNSLITAYVNVNQMLEAEKAFEKMKELGLVPDKFTYTTLMMGHTQQGNKDKAQDLLDQMQQLGLSDEIARVIQQKEGKHPSSQKMCRHGAGCARHAAGTCRFQHPPAEAGSTNTDMSSKSAHNKSKVANPWRQHTNRQRRNCDNTPRNWRRV